LTETALFSRAFLGAFGKMDSARHYSRVLFESDETSSPLDFAG
jgi:hypothetical protein